MAADVTKSVIVKVGVQGPAGADPLKAVAANARQSDEALRKMGDSGKKSLDQMKASADRAKASLDKLKGAGAGGGLGAGAGQGGGMFGEAAGGVGALRFGAAAAIGIKAGTSLYNDAVQFGQQAQDPEFGRPSHHSIQRARVSSMWWVPEGARQKVGQWRFGKDFDYDQASQDVKDRDRRIAEARKRSAAEDQKAALLDPFRLRQDALKEQAAAMTDRVTFGLAGEAEKRLAGKTLARWSAEDQAAARAKGEDPGEVRAKSQFLEQLNYQAIDHETQLKTMNQARGRALEDLAEKQQAVADSVKQEEALQRNLNAAGLSGEQRLERSLALEAQKAETMRKQKELADARNQSLTVEQSKLELIVQQHQQKVGLLEQEKARQVGIAESEADKLATNKADFGLMSVSEQQRQARLAAKLGAGLNLSQAEIAAARGNPLFADKLRELGMRRANESGIFDQVVGAVGADKKMREARERAVAIQNQIDVTVKMDTETITAQLVKQLTPAIAQAMAEARAAAAAALARFQMQQRADQGANAGK